MSAELTEVEDLEVLANDCGLCFLSESTPSGDLSAAVLEFAKRTARYDDLSHKRAKHVCEQRLKQAKLANEWRTLKAHFERERTSAQRTDSMNAGDNPELWRRSLTLTGRGSYAVTASNFMTIFRNSPNWKGVIARNDRTGNVVFRLPPPWKSTEEDWNEPTIEDADYSEISAWFERSDYAMSSSPKGDHLYAAIQTIARDNRYDPVRQYMERLKWDGTPRLNAMLHAYFAADGDEEGRGEYVEAVSSMWMLSAVARVFDPGCKVDTVLVLKGPQGALKSTAFRALAGGGEYFCDDAVDISNKDSWMRLHSCFIAELGEMDSINKSEITAMKAFVTRQVDKFREPYARVAVEHPRRFVFCASTNDDEFLKDVTGNRRFWIINTRGDRKVDVTRLRAGRDQLWAEAVHRYRSGEFWWMTDDRLIAVAKAEQEAHAVTDVWDYEIQEYAETILLTRAEQFVRVNEILEKLGKRTAERTNADKLRVVGVLKRLGFSMVRKRAVEGGQVERVYMRTT